MNCSEEKKLIYEESFSADMQSVLEYFAKISIALMHRMRIRILKKISLLKEFPEMGIQFEADATGRKRYWVIDGYVVLYTYEETTIYLNRMIDQRLDYTRYM